MHCGGAVLTFNSASGIQLRERRRGHEGGSHYVVSLMLLCHSPHTPIFNQEASIAVYGPEEQYLSRTVDTMSADNDILQEAVFSISSRTFRQGTTKCACFCFSAGLPACIPCVLRLQVELMKEDLDDRRAPPHHPKQEAPCRQGTLQQGPLLCMRTPCQIPEIHASRYSVGQVPQKGSPALSVILPWPRI